MFLFFILFSIKAQDETFNRLVSNLGGGGPAFRANDVIRIPSVTISVINYSHSDRVNTYLVVINNNSSLKPFYIETTRNYTFSDASPNKNTIIENMNIQYARNVQYMNNNIISDTFLFKDMFGQRGVSIEISNNIFRYKIIDGSSIMITRYLDNNTALIIPSTIDGLPVTDIDRNAFYRSGDQTRLTSLELPNTVRTIGERAFENNRIRQLILPDGIVAIGRRAFYNNELTELVLPRNLNFIEALTFDGGGNNLSTIIIPNSVRTIRGTAFRGPITRITIGASVVFSAYDVDNNPFTMGGIQGDYPKLFKDCYIENKRRAGTYTYSNNKWTYSGP
jgi:hypothetical protein